MISTCTAKIGSAVCLGTAGLAQIAPPTVFEWYEKFGIVGLLLAIIVALWADAKKSEKKVAEYRAEREKREDAHRAEDLQMQREFLNGIASLGSAIRENALRCDARRDAVENAVDKALESRP